MGGYPAPLIRLSKRLTSQADPGAILQIEIGRRSPAVPVQKSIGTARPETVLADRRNMAYAGTLVTYGQGRGIVVAIGSQTASGQIAEMITEAADLATPLTRKIAHFSRTLLFAISALAILIFVVGLLRRQPVLKMFMAAVALAVGMIPERLPAAVTITLDREFLSRMAAHLNFTLRSFRELTDRNLLNVQPDRITLHRSQAGETIRNLAVSTKSRISAEELSRLNRIAPDKVLAAGTLVKLIWSGR